MLQKSLSSKVLTGKIYNWGESSRIRRHRNEHTFQFLSTEYSSSKTKLQLFSNSNYSCSQSTQHIPNPRNIRFLLVSTQIRCSWQKRKIILLECREQLQWLAAWRFEALPVLEVLTKARIGPHTVAAFRPLLDLSWQHRQIGLAILANHTWEWDCL